MAGPQGRVSFVLEKAMFVEDCREIVIETNRRQPPLEMVSATSVTTWKVADKPLTAASYDHRDGKGRSIGEHHNEVCNTGRRKKAQESICRNLGWIVRVQVKRRVAFRCLGVV